MNDSFQPKTGSSDEAKTIQDDYKEAQQWCNFVLLEPTWLPADLTQLEQSLRQESEHHSSSYRIVIKGAERSLSIKQFLFDFAPPAYDHPNLWRNPKTTSKGEFAPPRAFPIQNQILWIGHDHRKMPAACIGFHRVRVEITVLEGVFSDQELINLSHHLTPADAHYAQVLQQMPFALLSYQCRYPQKATPVPLSYWHYKRDQNDYHEAKLAANDVLERLDVKAPDLRDLDYDLDSLFVIKQDKGVIAEVDFVYEAKAKNGAYVRFLVTSAESTRAMPYPPEIYTQACQSKMLTLGTQKIFQAWHTDDFGAYEACFEYGNHRALLLAQPSTWTNQAWFTELLEQAIKENPS